MSLINQNRVKLVKMIVEARIVGLHFTEYSQNHLMDEFIIMMLLNLTESVKTQTDECRMSNIPNLLLIHF
jgi:hypothetical protein